MFVWAPCACLIQVEARRGPWLPLALELQMVVSSPIDAVNQTCIFRSLKHLGISPAPRWLDFYLQTDNPSSTGLMRSWWIPMLGKCMPCLVLMPEALVLWGIWYQDLRKAGSCVHLWFNTQVLWGFYSDKEFFIGLFLTQASILGGEGNWGVGKVSIFSKWKHKVPA